MVKISKHLQLETLGSPQVGLGIRPELFSAVRSEHPELAFFEAHSENYFGDSINRDYLIELAQDYPVSLHGVALSLGRADGLDPKHLSELRRLVDAVDPLFVSDHLAWSAYQHQHLPDLLPLPLNAQSFKLVSDHIKAMQDAVGRQVLIENPSNYALFNAAQLSEPEFLNNLAHDTGCGLLLDVNNVYVSASNTGADPHNYIQNIDSAAIKEYHLAGYTPVTRVFNGEPTQILIDTHNQAIHDPVWDLFSKTLDCHGSRPTLVEWDSDYPPLDVLLGECCKANKQLLEVVERNKFQKTPMQSERLCAQTTSPPPCSEQAEPIEITTFQGQFLDSLLSKKTNSSAFLKGHADRLGVYQNNVFSALYDYLAEVYPALKGVVGTDFFKQLCHVFSANQPPQAGNIHLYGEGIASIFGDFDALIDMPYLQDLARYEWALHRAYFTAQEELIDHTTIEQDQLLAKGIVLNPTVELLDSAFPILAIHQQSLPSYVGDVSISLQQSTDDILVCKHQQQVVSLRLSPEQMQFFEMLKKPTTLLQAIEGMVGSISQEELSEGLSLCFSHGLLNSYTA